MKKLSLLFLVAISVTLTMCKKDDGGTNNNNNNNNNTPADYFPVKAGSTFTYNYYDSASSTSQSNTYTITGDSTVNGHSYTKFASDSGTVLRRKDGTSYYQLFSIPGIGIGDFDQLYLKDDVAAGTSPWSQPITVPSPPSPLSSLQVTFSYNVVSKTASMTVGSNTFTDVILVRMNVVALAGVSSPFPATFPLDMGGGNFYYARGVGRIKSEMDIEYKNNQPLIPATLTAGLPVIKYSETMTAYHLQ